MIEPAIDRTVIDALRTLNTAGEPDILEEVLALFRSEVPPRMEAISTAIAARDAAALQRAAHTLKGAAGNVGATRFASIAKALEDIGRSGTVDGSTRFMEELRVECERVEDEIKRILVEERA